MSKGLESFNRIKSYFNPKQLLTRELTLNDLDTIEKELKDYGKMLEEYDVDNYEQFYEITLRANAEYSKIKQALEIIKTKDFIDLKLLKRCKTHYEYNRQVAVSYDSRGMDIGLLTQEEYDFLREVLL